MRFKRLPLTRFFSSSPSSSVSTFDPLSKQWPITCTFDPSCTYSYLKQVEKKWMPVTCKHDHDKSSPPSSSKQSTKYILSMFPYPSGSLHLGHVKVYTSADMISRYLRLKGHKVITPLGWDSFGLPAENAAIDRDLNPADWTRDNIHEMRNQLDKLGLIAEYRQATSDPGFYKWTQYLITQLFDHKLMYRSRALVNWDPVDKTVLADDQVDDQGRSWRSGAKIEKRFLTQWFIKSSRFLKDLYEGQDIDRTSNGVNMRSVHDQQKAFMGNIDGRIFYLRTMDGDVVPVFADDGSCHKFLDNNAKVIISPNHWIASSSTNSAEKTKICNPFTGKEMGIEVSDGVTTNWKAVISSDSTQPATSTDKSHMDSVLNSYPSIGGYHTSSSYTDWLISRQRYWGTPMPIVHCSSCGPVPVPLSDLPVILPPVNDFQALKRSSSSSSDSGEVSSKLKELAPDSWLKCCCPKCGSPDARRETDTLDTFVDSSWYFLRYATKASPDQPFDEDFWSQNRVSAYLGGPEHVKGHLLTSRLMYHFLRSIGKVRHANQEPYEKFLTQGIINSKSYREKVTGKYLWQEEAEEKIANGEITEKDLNIVYEKMSKSKNNGVNPVDLIDRFGTDATRITVLGFGNSHKGRYWRGTEIEFMETSVFLRKLLLTMDQFAFLCQVRDEDHQASSSGKKTVVRRFTPRTVVGVHLQHELDLIKSERNTTVRDVAFCFESSYRIGLACSKLRALNETLRRHNLVPEVGLSINWQRAFGDLIILISCIAPNISHELWSGFVCYADKCLDVKSGGVFDFALPADQQSCPKLDADFVNKIKVNYDATEHYFEDKDVINQEDKDVVKKAAIAYVKTKVANFDENGMNFSVNFLPHMKAVVNMRSKGFDPKAIKKMRNKLKKGKSKKEDDGDSDDE